TSTASTIRDDAIQHWVGKVPSLSNERWLKRALGAARKRDRSSFAFERGEAGCLPFHLPIVLSYRYKYLRERL
ncbi:MAG: hypothetical protein ACI9KK_001601, partial [Ascidiaceihabitans sp.]